MTRSAADKPVRLSDVAKSAGVSQGTVSNVFNHPELVRPEVQEHVRATARKLGYNGPDPKGRLLRAGKVNAIGVATTQPLSYFFEDPYARALMTEISRASTINGCGISLISSENEELLSWNVGSALVDGLILFCLSGTEELVALARERNLPSVALAFGNIDQNLPVIDVDNVEGGRLAAAHLADLGHRRFAILAIEFDYGSTGFKTRAEIEAAIHFASRDRALGSLEILGERGIDRAAIPVYETNEDYRSVHAALETWFGQKPWPTAIIAQSDVIAMIALDWFAARGISVPGDVSIIGFDGVLETARTSPPLTTIAQPLKDIAQRAVNAILDPQNRPLHQILDAELVVRESTAPPPG